MRDPQGRRGFTLLELMVVLAVIAILALIALPNTMDRLVREQVAEALPLADVLKPPVEAAWRAGTPLPADNAAAGLPPPAKFVSRLVQSARLENGAIHLTFGNSAHRTLRGKVLSLRPAGVESARIVPLGVFVPSMQIDTVDQQIPLRIKDLQKPCVAPAAPSGAI